MVPSQTARFDDSERKNLCAAALCALHCLWITVLSVTEQSCLCALQIAKGNAAGPIPFFFHKRGGNDRLDARDYDEIAAGR